MDESTSPVTPGVTPVVIPGWYTNSDTGLQQYWDGTTWSDIPAPIMVDGKHVAFHKTETSDLAVIAFVFSFLVPFVGWILGFKARKEIADSQGKKTGGPLATASIWIGGIITVGVATMIAFCAITSIAFDQHFRYGYGDCGFRNHMYLENDGPGTGWMMNNRYCPVPMMGSEQSGGVTVDPRGGMMLGDQNDQSYSPDAPVAGDPTT